MPIFFITCLPNLRNQITELYEKFDYDSRRMHREFTDKIDKVYECIEKLQIGRDAITVQENMSPMNDVKETLANVIIGIIGLLLYITSAILVSTLYPFSNQSES